MKDLLFFKNRFVNGDCISSIMEDMEQEYQIPMIDNKNYNDTHKDIIDLYLNVANSRIC